MIIETVKWFAVMLSHKLKGAKSNLGLDSKTKRPVA